ncbi:MAG: hypothetical protein PHQ66_01855 [Candidatus Nanoarchaeia archaeon]|nr:hypothetical protein [Candidatus Nanoarchaeia archaeon]MDD5357881.1 hypothetical protein [Candidatus Nanoarchaeia archaeon]MDD5588800.1 hypothetical protein [Candidatus Nanoarchaeia archaeon]
MTNLNSIILFPKSLGLLNCCSDKHFYGVPDAKYITYFGNGRDKSFNQREDDFRQILKKEGFDGVVEYKIEGILDNSEFLFSGIPVRRLKDIVVFLPRSEIKKIKPFQQ